MFYYLYNKFSLQEKGWLLRRINCSISKNTYTFDIGYIVPYFYMSFLSDVKNDSFIIKFTQYWFI